MQAFTSVNNNLFHEQNSRFTPTIFPSLQGYYDSTLCSGGYLVLTKVTA